MAVIAAHAVSVDGYVTGRDPGVGRGLGDGTALFDWYFGGPVPSTVFDGFGLSAQSAPVFDALAVRIGAVVAGRNTYDDCEGFGGGSPHPGAPLVLLTHRPVPEASDRQTVVTSGIADAVAAAARLAGGADVGLMGGQVTASALAAGLVDELVVHQVPVLLGAGRPLVPALPAHLSLELRDVVAAPGVTHLHYTVTR